MTKCGITVYTSTTSMPVIKANCVSTVGLSYEYT